MTTIHITIIQTADGLLIDKTIKNKEQSIINNTLVPYNAILTPALDLLNFYNHQITFAEHIYIWSTLPKKMNDKITLKNKNIKKRPTK